MKTALFALAMCVGVFSTHGELAHATKTATLPMNLNVQEVEPQRGSCSLLPKAHCRWSDYCTWNGHRCVRGGSGG